MRLLRGHADGLGQRVVSQPVEGPAVEALRITADLAADAGFAEALAASLEQVAGVSNPRLGEPPGLEHVGVPPRPVLVAPHIEGQRLSALLADTWQAGQPLPTGAALFVIREVLDAASILHRQTAGACHGAIGPDRVVMTPDARVVLVDFGLGGALAAAAPRDPWHWWRAFGIAIPLDRRSPPFSPDTDQLQLGLLALTLLLGRPLGRDAYPDAVMDLVDEAHETDLTGEVTPLGPRLREWLLRLLHISDAGPYPDLVAATADLEQLLGEDGGYIAAPIGLEAPAEALQPIGTEPAGADQLDAGEQTTVGSTRRASNVGGTAKEGGPVPGQESGDADEFVEARAYGFIPPVLAAPEGATILDLANDLVGEGARQPAAGGDAAPASGVAAAMPARRAARPRRRGRGGWSRRAAATAASVVLLGGGLAGIGYYAMSGAGRPGRLHLESVPPGGTVLVEGKRVGVTPLDLTLLPGLNFVEVSGAHSSYTLALTVKPGASHTERVKLPEAGAPGTVVVRTEPGGVPVTVNGRDRGVSPLELQLPPGRHVVAAANDIGRIQRDVQVPAAGRIEMSLPVSGWIEVAAPIPVDVAIAGRRLVAEGARYPVAVGRHRVEFSNTALRFRESQDVIVEAGRVARVALTSAGGTLEASSDVPADVLIDGTRVGRTPVAGLAVPLGRHEVRFVHPAHGEISYDVFITTGSTQLHATFGAPAAGRTARPTNAATRRTTR